MHTSTVQCVEQAVPATALPACCQAVLATHLRLGSMPLARGTALILTSAMLAIILVCLQ
jgi:hypothetical protein